MDCPKFTYHLTTEPRLRCVYNAADEKNNRVGYAIGGAAGSMTGALLNGANFGQIMKAGAIGAFWGGLGAGVSFGVGEFSKHIDLLGKMLAHGTTQGAMTAAQGGKFTHGFFSGAFSAGLAPGVMNKFGSPAGRVLASSVIGGTASVLGGGKFANGAVTGAYVMLFNDMMHPKEKDKYKYRFGATEVELDAFKEYIAIVVSESSNNMEEAAAIGSVIMNRLAHKGKSLEGDFISYIGGKREFDGIGSKSYNYIMNSDWNEICSSNNPYAIRIGGAMMAVYDGVDYSKGAYFWNRSLPETGFNWRQYQNGTYIITMTAGKSTFFRYSDSNKKWP